MDKTKACAAANPDTARFASREYRISRGAYKAQCAFEYFIAILAGDAYLSKLLATIGLSDMQIGVISSFISLAFLFQLASILVVGHIRNVKAAGMLCNTLSSLLFTGLYLIPFLPFAQSVRTVLVVVCILAAYFCNYFMTSTVSIPLRNMHTEVETVSLSDIESSAKLLAEYILSGGLLNA